jgi:hypothetical protein
MIIAIYVIVSAIAILYLSTRLRETRLELHRVRGQRDAFARALELAGHHVPDAGEVAALTDDGQPAGFRSGWPQR